MHHFVQTTDALCCWQPPLLSVILARQCFFSALSTPSRMFRLLEVLCLVLWEGLWEATRHNQQTVFSLKIFRLSVHLCLLQGSPAFVATNKELVLLRFALLDMMKIKLLHMNSFVVFGSWLEFVVQCSVVNVYVLILHRMFYLALSIFIIEAKTFFSQS